MNDDSRPTGGGTKQAVTLPRWALAVIPLAVAAIVAVAFFAGRSSGGGNQEPIPADRPALGADGRINYATEGVIATDPETLQDQVDRMLEKAKEPGISLEYKNTMVSDDGVNFTCYLGNSANNTYDMFFTIYADQALTDELYLSELLRPGTRFEQITFQRKLEPGTYTGYLVHTQVKDQEQSDETYMQVIQGQIATTLTIVVNS